MDIPDLINNWAELGFRTRGYFHDDGNYVIEFLKGDESAGHITAVKGEGLIWSLPDELLNPKSE